MKATDFVKFLEQAAKMQKDNYSDVSSALNGVYFMRHEDDIIMLAMDGHKFFWEKFANIDKGKGFVSGVPLDKFEAAEKDNTFPFKIEYKELDKLISMSKVFIKSHKNLDSIFFEDIKKTDGAHGAVGLMINGETIETPILPVVESWGSFMDLYKGMVLHLDLPQQMVRRRKALCNYACYSVDDTLAALNWIKSHSREKAEKSSLGVFIAVYEASSKSKDDWELSFTEIRPNNTNDYGEIVMLMRVRPEDNPYYEED